MLLFMFVWVQRALQRAERSEEGQALTEYALILALVAIVAMASLKLLGGKISSQLTSVATSL